MWKLSYLDIVNILTLQYLVKFELSRCRLYIDITVDGKKLSYLDINEKLWTFEFGMNTMKPDFNAKAT